MKYDLDPADPTDHNWPTCADHADHTDPTQANMCERSRSCRSYQGKHNLDLADHTDPTPENINVCAKERQLRSHLGKRVWNKSQIMQGAPGKNVSVFARASYIRLTQVNTHTCAAKITRSYLLQDPQRNSLLPAAEIIFGRRATRAAATSAMLMLMLCFSSTWLCACGVW